MLIGLYFQIAPKLVVLDKSRGAPHVRRSMYTIRVYLDRSIRSASSVAWTLSVRCRQNLVVRSPNASADLYPIPNPTASPTFNPNPLSVFRSLDYWQRKGNEDRSS